MCNQKRRFERNYEIFYNNFTYLVGFSTKNGKENRAYRDRCLILGNIFR